MYKIVPTSKFEKDVKKIKKQGKDLEKLWNVITALAEGKTLDAKFRPHNLSGNYSGFMECHIEPDWLLIYSIYEDVLTLTLTRTGSHSDLF